MDNVALKQQWNEAQEIAQVMLDEDVEKLVANECWTIQFTCASGVRLTRGEEKKDLLLKQYTIQVLKNMEMDY